MMQYLVGVRVADAAEEMRVGERALERVILAAQLRGEVAHLRAEDFHAAGIERVEPRVVDEMNAGALLRARFGEDERARVEVEGGEPEPSGDLRALLVAPAEATGDHEMNDEVPVRIA